MENKFVLNKVFTGNSPWLKYKLGHEVINFIKADNNKSYIYMMPHGDLCSRKNVEYVFHVIGMGNNSYELLGISKINPKKINYDEEIKNIKYNGQPIYEIFELPNSKARLFTYEASEVLIPKNKRIIINGNSNKPDFKEINDFVVESYVKCNPKHNIAYSIVNDENIFEQILEIVKKDSVELKSFKDMYNDIDDELCYAVISDRTKLEDSTSNLIKYFLDENDLVKNKFISFLLNKKEINYNINSEFEILREYKNMDLFFKNEEYTFVIENKIDSNIVINKNDKIVNGKKESQLSRYYNFVKKSNSKNSYFYLLKPNYNYINLDEYINGNDYTIISYDELYKFFCDNKKYYDSSVFSEFLKSLEYISFTNSKKNKTTAYIRLKQKIKKLNNRGSINEK